MAYNYIPGTDGSEPTIYSTLNPDWIDGLLGDDEISAGNGDDLIFAELANPVASYSDNDRVYGDTFRDEASNDIIYGGYSNDTLYGGSYEGGDGSNDSIYRGLDNDLLFGDDSNDKIKNSRIVLGRF